MKDTSEFLHRRPPDDEMMEDLRGMKGDVDFYVELLELHGQLEKRLKYLSGGTRQKVSILLSLMFPNDLLILDEPTNGLDPGSIIRLKDHLSLERQRNKTIVFTTHIIPLVEEIADEIIFMLEGKIYFQGSVQELKSQQDKVNLERAIAHILSEKIITS